MQKPLKYFDVKIEVMVPAVVIHKVLAESPEAALEKVEKAEQPIHDVKYELHKRKPATISVYDSGTYNLHLKKKA